MFYFGFYSKIQKLINLSGYLQEHPLTDRDFTISTVFKLSFENTVKMMIPVKHFWSAKSSIQRG